MKEWYKITKVIVLLVVGSITVNAQTGWNLNPADYNLDFSVIAVLNVDGNFSEDELDKLGAFDNQGNIRGAANVVYNSTTGNYQVNLSVLSNSVGDTIHFRIYQEDNDSVYTTINDSISFQPNVLIGSIQEPLVIANTNMIGDFQLSDSVFYDSIVLGSIIGTFEGEFTNNTIANASYTLVSGIGDNDNSRFTISNNELRTNDSFDYYTDSTYTIRVQCLEDGNTMEKQFVIKSAPTSFTTIVEADQVLPFWVYPNPCEDILNIQSDYYGVEIRVVDLLGNVVKQITTSSRLQVLNLSDLSSGTYILNSELGSQLIEVK